MHVISAPCSVYEPPNPHAPFGPMPLHVQLTVGPDCAHCPPQSRLASVASETSAAASWGSVVEASGSSGQTQLRGRPMSLRMPNAMGVATTAGVPPSVLGARSHSTPPAPHPPHRHAADRGA